MCILPKIKWKHQRNQVLQVISLQSDPLRFSIDTAKCAGKKFSVKLGIFVFNSNEH